MEKTVDQLLQTLRSFPLKIHPACCNPERGEQLLTLIKSDLSSTKKQQGLKELLLLDITGGELASLRKALEQTLHSVAAEAKSNKAAPAVQQNPWSVVWAGGQPTAFGFHYCDFTTLEFWYTFYQQLQLINQNAKLNDVGCGNMEMSRLAKAYSKDFILHASDYADIKFKNISWAEGVHFHKATFEHIELPNESFDGICGAYAIEYADDFTAALREQFRLLKAGGIAGFLMHHPESYVVNEAHLSVKDEKIVRDSKLFQLAKQTLARNNSKNQKALSRVVAKLKNVQGVICHRVANIVEDAVNKGDVNLLRNSEIFFERKLRSQKDLLDKFNEFLGDKEKIIASINAAGFILEEFTTLTLPGDVKAWAVILRKPPVEQQATAIEADQASWSSFVSKVVETMSPSLRDFSLRSAELTKSDIAKLAQS